MFCIKMLNNTQTYREKIVYVLPLSISIPSTKIIFTHGLLCIFSDSFSMYLSVRSFLMFFTIDTMQRRKKNTHNLTTQQKFSNQFNISFSNLYLCKIFNNSNNKKAKVSHTWSKINMIVYFF